MTRQRYSIKESLNRILRAYKGEPIPDEAPNSLDGVILSEDEAWSDIAELFQDSLPGEVLYIPGSMSHRFGGIYSGDTTGTSQSLSTGIIEVLDGWGTDGLSSIGVVPNIGNDRFVVTEIGTYLVTFSLSIESPPGTATTFRVQVYVDGVAAPSVIARRGIGSTGAVCQGMGISGLINIPSISTSGAYVDLRVLTEDADRVFHSNAQQFTIVKLA